MDFLKKKRMTESIFLLKMIYLSIFLIYIMADVGNFLVDNKIDPIVKSGYTLSI
jgi:hypothetical protein